MKMYTSIMCCGKIRSYVQCWPGTHFRTSRGCKRIPLAIPDKEPEIALPTLVIAVGTVIADAALISCTNRVTRSITPSKPQMSPQSLPHVRFNTNANANSPYFSLLRSPSQQKPSLFKELLFIQLPQATFSWNDALPSCVSRRNEMVTRLLRL